MKQHEYIPELYWDNVATELPKRTGNGLLAGDDDPFYQYKRQKFVSRLCSISFKGRKVIEIGSGPGGNLLEIYKQQPALLVGADISQEMIGISQENIGNRSIKLVKINGRELPFSDHQFDIAITSTVLQHITENSLLELLVSDISRVTAGDIFIFERIEKKHKPSATNTGRTIGEYKGIFDQNDMKLQQSTFLNVYWSKLFCGMIRRIFNRNGRKEGARQSRLALTLQKFILPITKKLDDWIPVNSDLALLHFKKVKSDN
jgi:ubiquinone/menaquinone biosynthesis C-methylase UbiE